MSDALISNPALVGIPAVVERTNDESARLSRAVMQHYAFVWRTLRRYGVPEADADDAAQEVFIVLSRRISGVAVGSELKFLFHTSTYVASHARRRNRRRREVADEGLELETDESETPEAMTEQRQALDLLARALDALPPELKSVLILCEIEQSTMSEAAALLDLAPGTVASRLRRARKQFAAIARDLGVVRPDG